MLQKNNLLGLINDPIHKPVTLFWPTDTAIRRLPQEQQDFLFKKSNTEKLVQYLKFHIVRDAAVSHCFSGALPRQLQVQTYASPLFPSQVLAYQLPLSTSLKTLQGSNLSISCGDNREIVSVSSASSLIPYPCCRTCSRRPRCACAQPPERVSGIKIHWPSPDHANSCEIKAATPTDSAG